MSPLSRHLRCFLVTIAYAALCILTSSSAAIAPPTPPPIPPSPPADRAAALVANMTTEERLSLLAGTGWALVLQKSGYYVGNSVPIARLGIPALKMQDAAQGFRTTDKRMIGQVTSWPCSLAVAATWDLNLTRAWGRALGEEHRAKGANVILGPSINVHRVARGGRNAEYLSGESPALGAALTSEYIAGVQESPVLAVAKHFALNSQETNRNTVDSRASDRTLHEVYFPPFAAAVRAGAGLFMCAYNLVNGTHACGNGALLDRDLKQHLGFGGAVMSDWWAIHGDGAGVASNGTDMDMPGTDEKFSPKNLEKSGDARTINMAERVVTAILAGGLERNDTCTPGKDCDEYLYARNATSPAHVELAADIAAAGTVLLKNDGNVLPLRANATVAVMGAACDAPNDIAGMLPSLKWNVGNYYVMGGSGRVIPRAPISIIAGLRSAGVHVIDATTDDPAAAAAALARADLGILCGATTTTEGTDRKTLRLDQNEFIAGVLAAANSNGGSGGGSSDGKGNGGSNSGSGSSSVGSSGDSVPVVVVATIPGSIVMPWAINSSAIVTTMLAGQTAGTAMARVLTGMVNPSGRLPITIPLRESDTIPPCPSKTCEYIEGLNVGWRALQDQQVEYPFGHGLSYTSFSYAWAQSPGTGNACRNSSSSSSITKIKNQSSDASADDGLSSMKSHSGDGVIEKDQHNLDNAIAVCASVVVTNTGKVAGAEVVQLYVAYPISAGEPPLILKGFKKTPLLAPGTSITVHFDLTAHDLSTWSAAAANWMPVMGNFVLSIGASSRDFRLNATVALP